MSAKNLTDFISEVKKDGLARQNRFTVTITPPISMSNLGDSTQLAQLFCEQASLPSVSYASQPVKTFGENREVVYDRNYEDITLSFLVDRKMMVKAYFDEWSNAVIDPISRVAGFYEDYAKDIVISVQDTEDNNVYTTVLYEAYPKTIGAVQLDHNSKDIMKLQVTFTYKYHLNTTVTTVGGEPQIRQIYSTTPAQQSPVTGTNLQNYMKGSIGLPGNIPELYFSNFNEYQQTINDSIGARNALNVLERQGMLSGIGGLFN